MSNYHEDDEQAALFDWAAYHPVLKWMHAIPNGGNRNAREAARLKRQGVKKGVSDIFLPLPLHGYCGLYIEMKRSRKHGRATVSQEQKKFIDDMNKHGYRAVVCYGSSEAIATIRDYLGI